MSYEHVRDLMPVKLTVIILSFTYRCTTQRIAQRWSRICFSLTMGLGGAQAATDDVSGRPHRLDKAEHFYKETEYFFELGFDSQYIAQGRSQLEDGGILWGTAVLELEGLHIYSTWGQAVSQHYSELNLGIGYAFVMSDSWEMWAGYQRVEIYGDEPESDNELFSILAYKGIDWFTPSIDYTYGSQSKGHFVEVSLHGKPLALFENGEVTPYITQAFDVKYANGSYTGANHMQFGIEFEYTLYPRCTLSGHISHVIPHEGIKREQSGEWKVQTFTGLHFSWLF